MKTSPASAEVTLDPLTSSAVDSPARTLVPLAKARALAVLEAAFGTSTCVLSESSNPSLSLLKTSEAVPDAGLTSSEATWQGPAIRAYRSRLAPLMSALRIFESESSLLPTSTASAYDSNVGGSNGRVGKIRYSLSGLAKRGLLLLPTPRADDGRQGRASASPTTARRVAEGRATLGEYIQERPALRLLPTPTVRDSGSAGPAELKRRTIHLRALAKFGLLATPTATANQLMPSMNKWPCCAAWQAIHPRGPLLPSFVEWMMGFPYDWTVPHPDPSASKP